MKKQLFVVYYLNKDSEQIDTTLLISTGDKIREKIHNAILKGEINTNQYNPTVLGYSYIDGYTIEALPDTIENIAKLLEAQRHNDFDKGVSKDLNNYYGYLEGIRDFVDACREQKKETDVPDIEIPFNNSTYTIRNTINNIMGSSNIPKGYSEDGERL